MFAMWVVGAQPADKTIHFENGTIADAMRDAWGVKMARAKFYKKYEGAQTLDGASLTKLKAEFGIVGLLSAGLDPVEQFVGGYTVNITVEAGMLRYDLWNRTSFQSLLYGKGPSWFGGPMGNMDQTYTFWEPIRTDWQWKLP